MTTRYDLTRQFPLTLLGLISHANDLSSFGSLVLNGTSGSQGGVGTPPWGVTGQLAQRYIAFDTTEAASQAAVGGSGSISSLVDNLNRIRYDIRHIQEGWIPIDGGLSWASGSLQSSGGSGSGSGLPAGSRGDIARYASDWEAYSAKTAGFIVQGDGTDVKSAAFDWDTFSAGSGADMVHDHSTSAEGGSLSGVDIASDSANITAVNFLEDGKPSAPALGHRIIYAKSTGIYAEDSAGVEVGPFGSIGYHEVVMETAITPPNPVLNSVGDDWIYSS